MDFVVAVCCWYRHPPSVCDVTMSAPPPSHDHDRHVTHASARDTQMRYAGLGEVEAGAASIDPAEPHIYQVAYPDTRSTIQCTTNTKPSPPSPSPSSSSSSHDSPIPPVPPCVASDPLSVSSSPPPNGAQEEIHKQVHIMHEMFAGSASAAVSRFCVAPLDVLKIRFQIQEQASQNRQYKSVAQAFKTIYKTEGIRVTNKQQDGIQPHPHTKPPCVQIYIGLCALTLCFGFVRVPG